MEENPYSAILNTFRDDADSRSFWPWQLGEVVTVEPLVIRSGGQELRDKELWVNYQLRENEEPVRLEEVTAQLQGTTDCSVGDASQFTFTSGTLEARGIFGGVLHPGDRVALLVTCDGQEFVVLCRVVEA